MLTCPFCGAPETTRFDLEGKRFLVFRCMFSPAVDPTLSEEALARYLGTAFEPGAASGYFRHQCDRLHVYVTKGKGAEALARKSSSTRPGEPGP